MSNNKHPRIIRYSLHPRKEGNSFYFLLPYIINQFWGLNSKSVVTMEYDTENFKLLIKNDAGWTDEKYFETGEDNK